MNVYMQMLFIFGAGAFLTWWFLQGLLNPFIKAVFSIVITGLFVVVSFFFGPFIFIARKIIDLLHWIFGPVWMKILVYSLVGIGILILDHLYNTRIFAEDETTFYSVVVKGTKYWITLPAIEIAGFFLFLAACYTIGIVLRGLNTLLDHPMHISIVVHN